MSRVNLESSTDCLFYVDCFVVLLNSVIWWMTTLDPIFSINSYCWGLNREIQIRVKVSKSQNKFMKSSFFPKNKQNIARISALNDRAEILAIFRSFFGRNDDFINLFWDLLTFTTYLCIANVLIINIIGIFLCLYPLINMESTVVMK